MKATSLLATALVAFAVSFLRAAHGGGNVVVVFKGYMVTKDRPLFVIEVDGHPSGWIPLASKFESCKVSGFDPKDETLTVNSRKSDILPLMANAIVRPPDPDEPLRTLKGFPLVYEVARRGDEPMRLLLIRYQEASSHATTERAGPRCHEIPAHSNRTLSSQWSGAHIKSEVKKKAEPGARANDRGSS